MCLYCQPLAKIRSSISRSSDIKYSIFCIYNLYHTYIYIYPPTPAASRGSASEEALLATRGEKRKLDKQEEEKQPEAARKLAKQKGRRAGKVQGLELVSR